MNPESVFKIKTNADFDEVALNVFGFQYENNPVYREFCNYLHRNPNNVNAIDQIPFLPIEFFKSHEILSTQSPLEITFTSSGTTGSLTSKHLVTDLTVYEESFRKGFSFFYGNIKDYTVLALLPAYLERTGSSLIYMVNDMIEQSEAPESGFYLDNLEELAQHLKTLDAQGKKVLLIGVSFALLDLVEAYDFNLKNTIVMETGGMKGRRKEMIREELHSVLSKGFGVNKIHSEYGMTELLSQGYSKGNGVFECPPWMDIIIRDTEDALTIFEDGKSGGINVIDLANINSCSFIATQDLGRKKGKEFEVLGRFDHSDIRGCNLMVL
ncbi:acyl transferase [Joostella sp.]|uniref:LuxE/PaaK family acyltransferase n=1 Tax=Joostella sp. TaxID=2231138 RepID=UPI003A8E1F6B